MDIISNFKMEEIEIIKLNKKTALRNPVLIIYLCDSEEDQLELWKQWNELYDSEKMIADQNAIELYGFDNEKANAICINYLDFLKRNATYPNKKNETTLIVDQGVKSVIISDNEEKLLERQSHYSGIVIIHRKKDLKEQMLLWNRYRILNPEFKKLSNQMSLKICGITNEDHHKALMSYWKTGSTEGDKEDLVGEGQDYQTFLLKDNIEVPTAHKGSIESVIFKNNKSIVVINNLLDENGNSQVFYRVSNNPTVTWNDLYNFDSMKELSNTVYSILLSEENIEMRLNRIEADYFINGSVVMFKLGNRLVISGDRAGINDTYNKFSEFMTPKEYLPVDEAKLNEINLDETFNIDSILNTPLKIFLEDCIQGGETYGL